MKLIVERKKVYHELKLFLSTVLVITLMMAVTPASVKAEINEDPKSVTIARTAYLDMSSISPLELHFTEDDNYRNPDYYYAALAFNILKERQEIDPMYCNCAEVIVVIHHAFHSSSLVTTASEPQVQTGYLNLLSKESNKYYTIDQVIIHIQRDK